MGIRNYFNNLIRAKPLNDNSKVSVQTVSSPSLLSLRSNLYDMPEIRTAIQKTANHFARIRFNHLRQGKDDNYEKIKDSIHYCLNIRANKYQSAFDFKQKLATFFYLGQDIFINPTWTVDMYRPKLDSIEIIDYYGYEVGINTKNREIVIKFYLADGKNEWYYLSDLWFLQRFPQGINNTNNQVNKNTIADWITIATGIKNATLKASEKTGDISLVVLTQQNLKDAAYVKKVEEINNQVANGKNGVVFIGGSTSKEVMSVNPNVNQPQPQLVDDIINHIYKFYESNTKIVGGTANSVEFEQYIDSAIKPLVEKLEQEATHKCFSKESLNKGNVIQGYLVDVMIASLQEKTQWYKEMSYAGILLIDEVREQNGLPPMPNGLGRVPMTNKNSQTIENMLKGGDKVDSTKTNNGSTEDSDSGGQGRTEESN